MTEDGAVVGDVAINAARLVRTRLAAWIQLAAANGVATPPAEMRTLPGQGVVVTGIGLGGRLRVSEGGA
jgi:hypothetical protein